jgi:hypothetical protein
LQAYRRELDAGVVGTSACKIDSISADAASNFKHSLGLPAGKIRKPRDVRLDEILTLLHFSEVRSGSYRLCGMTHIARPCIPIFLYVTNRGNSLSHGKDELLGTDKLFHHKVNLDRPIAGSIAFGGTLVLNFITPRSEL